MNQNPSIHTTDIAGRCRAGTKVIVILCKSIAAKSASKQNYQIIKFCYTYTYLLAPHFIFFLHNHISTFRDRLELRFALVALLFFGFVFVHSSFLLDHSISLFDQSKSLASRARRNSARLFSVRSLCIASRLTKREACSFVIFRFGFSNSSTRLLLLRCVLSLCSFNRSHASVCKITNSPLRIAASLCWVHSILKRRYFPSCCRCEEMLYNLKKTELSFDPRDLFDDDDARS